MLDIDRIDWNKMNGMVPAVVQHALDGRVLMVGYMNQQAIEATQESGRVTFWSRSREQLWTKGETSGNYLELVSVSADCDNDCLLVLAKPAGPTCHLGTDSCFGGANPADPLISFLPALERIITNRQQNPNQASYTSRLFDSGVQRIAQKVGEEGVETALAGASGEREELIEESADLLYHLLVLLRAGDVQLDDVVATLAARHQP